jgi:hypothetical protein
MLRTTRMLRPMGAPVGRSSALRSTLAARRRTMSSSHFSRMDTPVNIGVVVVPQQMAYVIERFGRFHTVLDPGLQFLVPLMHKVRYVFSLKEETLTVPNQAAVTRDNVSITIDGVLYVKVVDPYRAAYGVEDPHFAITQLAQTTSAHRHDSARRSASARVGPRLAVPPRVRRDGHARRGGGALGGTRVRALLGARADMLHRASATSA